MLNGVLLLAVVAAAAAGLFALLWRSADARGGAVAKQLETRTAERDQLEQTLKREQQARKKQADELASLRRRADKAKKRQGKAPEQPLGTASRIRDLEERIARAESERDRVVAGREELEREVSRLQARVAASAQALEVASRPPVVVEPVEDALAQAQRDSVASRERIAKLEEELEGARHTEARMRKRMDIQEQLYASMRGELDAKKDRLRTQEEQLQRLQALKVAVVD